MLSAETKAWLEGLEKEGALAPEVIKGLRDAADANPKADEYLKGSVLRQSDYSRTIAEVKKAQKDLETAQAALQTKEAAVTKYQADLGTWKAGAEEAYRGALAEREKANIKATAAVSRLRSVAEAQGLSPDEILRDLDIVPAATTTTTSSSPTSVDTSKFLTKEELYKAQNDAGLIDAMVYDIAAEYQELYGKPPRGLADVVKEAIASGKPLKQFCEEKWEFGKKRNEQAEASITHRIAEAVAAKEAELRSSLPLQQAPRPGEQRSPVLESPSLAKAAENPESGGVSAATAAWQAGKYRQGLPGRG